MRVHCDLCGAEIVKEDALAVPLDDDICYFCSPKCAEERGYHETMRDPGRDDDANAPDPR